MLLWSRYPPVQTVALPRASRPARRSNSRSPVRCSQGLTRHATALQLVRETLRVHRRKRCSDREDRDTSGTRNSCIYRRRTNLSVRCQNPCNGASLSSPAPSRATVSTALGPQARRWTRSRQCPQPMSGPRPAQTQDASAVGGLHNARSAASFPYLPYSYRKELFGSTFAARYAGTMLANSATRAINPATITNVNGSLGLMSYTRLDITRPNTRASAAPIARPSSVGFMASTITSRKTSGTCAPSAKRMPISLTRRLTLYDNTL